MVGSLTLEVGRWKSGVGKSGVGKSGVGKSGVECQTVEGRGTRIEGRKSKDEVLGSEVWDQ